MRMRKLGLRLDLVLLSSLRDKNKNKNKKVKIKIKNRKMRVVFFVNTVFFSFFNAMLCLISALLH